jgi:dimethylhistidine N-methyltransferase
MAGRATFHDYHPGEISLYRAVVEGLGLPAKAIPPKFFYDERGSQLFDAICEQPEYYPPRAEREILEERAAEIASLTGSGCVLIEPGAGSLAKVRYLLDALRPSAFVPMDISGAFLRRAAEELAADYAWLPVHAACVDFTHSMPLPAVVPPGRRVAFFPGSSLGNFDPPEAAVFLRMVRDTLGPDGMLLIGVDTKKPEAILNAAYNDAAGVTAEFNLNLLHRIQRELGADCDPGGFRHRAFYDAARGRVEMHLVSAGRQEVLVNGHRFGFAAGETVHTECSYKYAPAEFLRLAGRAGFEPVRHWLARRDLFGVYLLRAL